MAKLQSRNSFLMFIIVLAFSSTFAGEPALVITADDDSLQWGPCPDFMPAECEIAVLHGDPAKPNVDILFRVPGDTALPNHWHTSAERMILLSGELHVTYEGQEKSVIEAGSYAYGPAERPHDGFCAEGDPCVLFIAFEAPLDAFPIEVAATDRTE